MQQKYKQKAIKHIKQQQTGNQQSFTAKQHFNEEEKKRSNKSCHPSPHNMLYTSLL